MTSDRAIIEDGGYWDVIVIGTGMGGGMLGHSVASQGKKVLFLEKGLAALSLSGEIIGSADNAGVKLHNGEWPHRVRTVIDGVATDAFLAAGCGVGGSTQLYAASLERFARRDFETVADMVHPTGGWPVRFDDFAPYYARAEKHLRVRGTRDPIGDVVAPDLLAPAPASDVDNVLLRDFEAAGLRPYRLPVGIAYRDGCRECLGRACPAECKSDTKWLCVNPAVGSMGAELRAECEVIKIEANTEKVTGVIYQHGDQLFRVRGRTVALAAGAYNSSVLLLRSATGAHPDGLANSSGLVGRNLMFHSSDWLAVWPSAKASAEGPRKTISSRYFYDLGGLRMGTLQSTGLYAGYGNILIYLYTMFDRSIFRRLKFARPLLRIPAKIAAYIYGSASIFALLVEDLPSAANRIRLKSDKSGEYEIIYNLPDELRARIATARKAISAKLGGQKLIWLYSNANMNFGHPCGTCRFGDNASDSVLDPSCRAHDLENLYVVDASFMPTSAGSNPSLTIAANALRVADILVKRLEQSETSAAPEVATAQ